MLLAVIFSLQNLNNPVCWPIKKRKTTLSINCNTVRVRKRIKNCFEHTVSLKSSSLYSQPCLHSAVSALEKGLAAPFIILPQGRKMLCLFCISLSQLHVHLSWAVLWPEDSNSVLEK